jgi:hypothetical protein
MAYGPYRDINALAAAIAADLFGDNDPAVTGNAGHAAAAIGAAIERNFKTAVEIDREVESQMRQLGSQTAGMDTAKIRSGLRARIAKQKGFAL